MCHYNLLGSDDGSFAWSSLENYNTLSYFNLNLVKNLASDISINHF